MVSRHLVRRALVSGSSSSPSLDIENEKPVLSDGLFFGLFVMDLRFCFIAVCLYKLFDLFRILSIRPSFKKAL